MSQRTPVQTAVSVGATLLGAFMGRKAMSVSTIGRACNAISRAGRSMEQAGDIGRVQVTAIDYQRQLDDLNAQFQEETNALEAKINPANGELEPAAILPKKPTSLSSRCLECGRRIAQMPKDALNRLCKTKSIAFGCTYY